MGRTLLSAAFDLACVGAGVLARANYRVAMDSGCPTPSRSLRRGGQGAESAIRIREVEQHPGRARPQEPALSQVEGCRHNPKPLVILSEVIVRNADDNAAEGPLDCRHSTTASRHSPPNAARRPVWGGHSCPPPLICSCRRGVLARANRRVDHSNVALGAPLLRVLCEGVGKAPKARFVSGKSRSTVEAHGFLVPNTNWAR